MKALQGSKSSCRLHPSALLFAFSSLTRVVHGSGASVLTCGCGWGTVSLERATGETIVTGSVIEESWQHQKRSNS